MEKKGRVGWEAKLGMMMGVVLRATWHNTQGNFTVELYFQHAPRTCHNFAGTSDWSSVFPLPPNPPTHPPSLPSHYYRACPLRLLQRHNFPSHHKGIRGNGERV